MTDKTATTLKDKEYFEQVLNRPCVTPDSDLTLGLYEVGHVRLPAGVVYPKIGCRQLVILWVIKGRVILHRDSINLHGSENQVICFGPGGSFSCSFGMDGTEIRYIAVDGPEAGAAAQNRGLWEGVFPCIEPPWQWLKIFTNDIIHMDRQKTMASFIPGIFSLICEEAGVLARDKIVWEAQKLIQAEWNNPAMNVSYVLQKINVTRSTLNPRFNKCTGQSILDYLHTIRLRHARHLLTATNQSCKQVANDCGFEDSAYFSRWFQKRVGHSPQAFRARACQFADRDESS